ncbi:MAG: VTT domain-containing protein [Pseudomonadota bacterium]
MPDDRLTTRRTWLKPVVLVLALAGLYLLFNLFDYDRHLTRDGFSAALADLRARAESMGLAAPPAFTVAAVAAIMAYIPAVVVIYFAVCIFGGIYGALLSAVGIYLAVTVIYFTARFLGRDWVARFAGSRLARFEARLQGRGFWAVLYLRLLFFVIPPTNWLLGLSSLSFRDVFWGTVLGTIHHIVIFSWLTETVVNAIQNGGSLNPLETRELLTPLLAGLIIFGLVRLVDRGLGKIAGRRAG